MSTQCKTLSVPEAGKLYYGLSRNGSYDAARRGEIPVIRVGRQYRVPIAAMEKILDRVGPKPSATP
jgi:excisionase family DNA binding protein